MNDSSNNKSELDEYGVWIKTPPQDAAVNLEKNETNSSEEINLDDFNMEALEKNITAASTVTESSFETEAETEVSEFNPEDIADIVDENELESSIPEYSEETSAIEESPVMEESTTEPSVETEMTMEDGEIDLDSFMNDDTPAPASSAPDGEIDLDSFMGDSSGSSDGEVDLSAFMGDDAPSFGDGDIDLDSFMGGESFASDKQEMQEIEETDPLDIDLEFEDGDPFAIEQEDSSSSLNLNDFSDGESAEDFDNLFDSIQDENPSASPAAETHSASTETSTESEEIDLSDFGIDDESENLNPVIGDENSNKVTAGPVDYDMTIDIDEDNTSEVEEHAEEDDSTDDEDYDIDITRDNVEEVQKQQKTDLSSPDDDFDVDALFDNIEDESGNTTSLENNKEKAESDDQKNQGDNQVPMFQEDFPVKSEDEFTLAENSVQESEIEIPEIDDQDKEEIEIPETLDQDLAVPESETDSDDFSLPDFDEDSSSQTEFSADNFEAMIENTVEEEIQIPVTDEADAGETEEAEQTADETTEETGNEEEFSIDEFMGDEGFTDGGIGVTGPYNEDGTLIEKYIKHDENEDTVEETAEDITEETLFEEPVMETADEPAFETAVEETADEPAVENDFTFEEAETESFEEPLIENTVEEPTAFDDDSTTLDMETLNNIAADAVSDENSFETETSEVENEISAEKEEEEKEEETSFEEPVMETADEPAFETAVEETADEPAVENDFTFEEAETESFEEPLIENTVEEPTAFDDDSTTLDMETLNNIAADAVSEPDVIDEPDEDAFDSTGIISDDEMEKVFESEQNEEPTVQIDETENSTDDTFLMDGQPEEIEEETSEETEETDNTEETQVNDSLTGDNMEEKDLDVSAYIDKGPDYDMTGVSLTLDDFENLSSQPVIEPEAQTIPDTFEEEAAFLTSDTEDKTSDESEEEKKIYSVFVKTSSTEKDEVEVEKSYTQTESSAEIEENETIIQETDPETAKEKDMSDESEAILKQISSELANLRSEINGLKDEFETIKKNGIPSENEASDEAEISTQDISVSEESAEEETQSESPAQEKEDTGFFADTDEDDTIALSGDELSNILNSADFAPADNIEESEETNTGLSMNFEEELEEPVFDETQESEAEEEIEVPTVDDVLVESAGSDLMSTEIRDDNEDNVIEADETIITEDDIPSPTLESLELPEPEPLTEGNMDFLTSDPAASMDFSEENEEDEELETGISEDPVEEVFNAWENNESLPDVAEEIPVETEVPVEEPVAEEPVVKDPVVETEEPAATKTASSSSDIPENMKDEIRSVLAYMDQLLENLPEDKIEEFAQSEQFETYKKLFSELGLS